MPIPSRSSPADHSEPALLDAARQGSVDALGELLDGCRQYLLLIAHDELDSTVRIKAAVSDLVQETFVEACRDFPQFTGESPAEFRGWLRQMLLHNIANVHRDFGRTQKRRIDRELRLDDSSMSAVAAMLADSGTSPSGRAIAAEKRDRLDHALSSMSADDQLVIELRHRDKLTFAEIGERMNRSADAARMLWWRAFERLCNKLESDDE